MSNDIITLTYLDQRTKELYDQGLKEDFLDGYCDGFKGEINDRYFYASRAYLNGLNLGLAEGVQFQDPENFDKEEDNNGTSDTGTNQ